MKKQLLLFLLAFSISGIVNAQQVFPSYADNPVWNTGECSMAWGSPTGLDCNTGTYSYSGQDSICGKLYNRVNNWWFVREENQKVYFRKDSNCSRREYLLYDFGMQPGDTVYTGFAIDGLSIIDTAWFTLRSIDTIQLHGVTRRVFNLRTERHPGGLDTLTAAATWIEGVGSTLHPFHAAICWLSNCETTYSTLCAFSNGQQTYGDTGPNACQVVLSQPEAKSQLSVTVYPNPARELLNLKLAEQGDYQVQILDMLGRIVVRQQFSTSGESLEASILLKVQSGLYLLEVKHAAARQTFRLVVE